MPLIAYLIKQCTQTNGLVLDAFLGSASTLIASEELNRVCYGIELEPKFVDVAVKRYIELKVGNSDGVIATIMALDRAIRFGNDNRESVYDDRGLLFI